MKVSNDYFDNIDNPHKAYWLGFLWSDGYVWKRIRKNSIEYGLKLDVSEVDYDLLVQFKKDLNILTDIKKYKPYKNGFSTKYGVCRCSYYNKSMIETLMNKYGIIPHRTDVNMLLNYIPKQYERDFIRGVLDADGSFTFYQSTNKKGYLCNKFVVSFGGTEDLLTFVWQHLKNNNIIFSQNRPQLHKRHKERDGVYFDLKLCGGRQAKAILDYLYNNADIYLSRKYQKYQNIKTTFK